MKQHTQDFKEEIKLIGKQQEVQITFGNTILTSEQINSVTPSYEGSLLKSVMKQLDIDSNENIPAGTEIDFKYGLWVNGAYEYIDFGKYIVKETEKQEDTGSYLITCYDKLLYSMKNYENIGVIYPISVKNYLISICNHLGLVFKDSNFANANRIIQNELYLDTEGGDLGYTFRDVLDEIAQVSGGVICINSNDEVEVRYINNTGDTIDEEYLKDVNVNFGEKYGPINSIVLSRAGESDNVYLQDETSIAQNGLCELKISENQIMNFNDRSDYLLELFEKLNGVEYYLNDFTSTGIIYYDLLDKYNVKIGDNTYNCLMLNDEVNITQGLEEIIYTDMPETSETDYTKADKTDRKINQTYVIANKQEGKITALSSSVEEIEKDLILTKTTEESKEFYITDTADNYCKSVEIFGESTQETRSGKNLIHLNSSRTSNGVTVTNNGDGTITLNGTATASMDMWIANGDSYLASDYKYSFSTGEKLTQSRNIISGTYSGNWNLRTIVYNPEDNQAYWSAIVDDITYTTTFDGETRGVELLISSGATFDNVILFPQLEIGDVATDPEQYGTMPSPEFPSEIESVSGKNLLNIETSTINKYMDSTGSILNSSTSSISDYIEVTEESKYTLYYGTISNYYKMFCFYDKSKSFLGHYTETNTNTKTTITTPKNAKYVRFHYVTTNAGITQFEKGDLSSFYVPYNHIGFKSVGKNLLKKYNGTGAITQSGITATMNTDGTITLNGNGTGYAWFEFIRAWEIGTSFKNTPIFSLDTSKQYTYSIKIISGTYSGRLVSALSANSEDTNQVIVNYPYNKTFSNSDGIYRGWISTDNTSVFNNLVIDLQLEEGDTATDYEPYKESIATIPLLHDMRSLPNGVRDRIYYSNGKWYDEQNVGQVVLNGSESWNWGGTYTNTVRFDGTVLNGSKAYNDNKIVTSHFTSLFGNTNDVEHCRNAGATYPTTLIIYINKDRLSDVSAGATAISSFKTWLSENNVEVIYLLAEPIITEITDEAMIQGLESIRTFKGTTIITADANSILTYYRNVPFNDQYETKQNASKNYRAINTQYSELTIEQDNIKSTVSDVRSIVDEQGTLIEDIESDVSEVEQTAERISSEVSKKVGEDEVISKINQSAEQVQIDANKISLRRKNNRFDI